MILKQFGLNTNFMGSLKTHGDIIERHFADRIHEVFPSYEILWSRYIGNDGHARSLPMPHGNRKTEESREKCWQRLYTILESVAICWDIEEELENIKEINSVKIYTRNLNQWMAFYAHLGRIHDMVKAIANELTRASLLKPFNDYWQERNIVLHGPKVPMKFVCNVLKVPSFGENPRKWNDKMVWSQLGPADFDFITAGVTSILRGLEPKLERLFAELNKVLPATFGWQPVVWPDVSKTNVESSLRVKYSSSTTIETYASGNGLASGTGGISGSGEAF